jgi:hypothetical protein
VSEQRLLEDLRATPDRTEYGRARTTCACADCSTYCTSMPGYLIPADLPRIEAATGRDLSDLLLASPGARVKNSATDQEFQIPTLVPARRRGRCMFLTDAGRCGIHAVSPFGCAFFDAHVPKDQADALSAEGLVDIHRDHANGGAYSRLWTRLWREGRRAPGPAVARRR